MARRKSKKKSQKNKLNMQVAALLVVSILLAILIYTKSGYIGESLSPILGGIMGWIKYIIPIGGFGVAIFLAKGEEDPDEFTKKIIEYVIFLLCITTIITTVQSIRGEILLDGKFKEVVKQAYYQGTRNEGGGAAGAIFAYGFSSLLRKNRSNNCSSWNSINRFYFPIWS